MEDSVFDVEQMVVAVKLTSAQNEVATEQATSGVIPADRDEIMARAARVRLFNGRFESSNLFSFRLPSGASAVGRLIPKRGKPIGSGEFFFQCLIATSEVFYRCGADPVRLALHAMNTTFFSAYRPGDSLKKFKLDEPISCANLGEVRRTTARIGARAIAALTQALFQYGQTFFVSDYHAFLLVSNVFSLLPVFARRALSFSAGLFFADDRFANLVGVTLPRRVPFRSRETLDAESFLDLRDVAENGAEYPVDVPWARLVEDVLTRDLGDSFFYRIAKSFLDEDPPLERSDDPQTLLKEVDELSEDWRAFFNAESDDVLESFEGFSVRSGDDGEGDGFDSFGAQYDEDDDSEGEEWKQGSAYNSNDYDEILNEEVDDEDDGSDDDDALHKVRFVEIPGNLEDDAQNKTSERSTGADLDALESLRPLNAQSVCADEVARFLEERVARREDDEAERSDGAIGLAPFTLLSVEFPTQNAQLRRLDALIVCALSGNASAKLQLKEYWKKFRAESERETTTRARDVYFQNLLVAVRKDDDGNAAREEQLQNILDVATIMAE